MIREFKEGMSSDDLSYWISCTNRVATGSVKPTPMVDFVRVKSGCLMVQSMMILSKPREKTGDVVFFFLFKYEVVHSPESIRFV